MKFTTLLIPTYIPCKSSQDPPMFARRWVRGNVGRQPKSFLLSPLFLLDEEIVNEKETEFKYSVFQFHIEI